MDIIVVLNILPRIFIDGKFSPSVENVVKYDYTLQPPPTHKRPMIEKGPKEFPDDFSVVE